MNERRTMLRYPREGTGGAVAVEFAIVAPILLVLIVGALAYGLITFQESMLEAAVRAGAHVANAHNNVINFPSGQTCSGSAYTDATCATVQAVLDAVPFGASQVKVALTTSCTCLSGSPCDTTADTPCTGTAPDRPLTYVRIAASQPPWYLLDLFTGPLAAATVFRLQ